MSSRRTLLKSATAVVALALAMPAAAQDEPMPVVATFSILGDMVARIGAEHVSVTTLVGPDGDAHVYQPTPADARAVAEAEVLIQNGLEFEGWIERLVEASEFGGMSVMATEGVEAIAYEEDDHGHEDHEEHQDEEHADHDEHEDHDHDHDHDASAEHDHEHEGEEHADHEHDHDHDGEEHAAHDHGEEHAADDHEGEEHASHDHEGHDHGAFDPHAWQSLSSGVIYAGNIAEALSAADPDNAETYSANAEAYVAEMQALDAEIAGLIGALPAERRTVVTSHDAFGYFGRDYGLTFLAPQGLSTESEASAQDVAQLIVQMREDGISAVFLENIADSRLLEQIANETGAAIGGTLYPGALSGPDGPAPTYLDMMRHNAMTLAAALGS